MNYKNIKYIMLSLMIFNHIFTTDSITEKEIKRIKNSQTISVGEFGIIIARHIPSLSVEAINALLKDSAKVTELIEKGFLWKIRSLESSQLNLLDKDIDSRSWLVLNPSKIESLSCEAQKKA